MYVQRNNEGGIVMASWAPVLGYAEEYLHLDAVELVAFFNSAT